MLAERSARKSDETIPIPSHYVQVLSAEIKRKYNALTDLVYSRHLDGETNESAALLHRQSIDGTRCKIDIKRGWQRRRWDRRGGEYSGIVGCCACKRRGRSGRSLRSGGKYSLGILGTIECNICMNAADAYCGKTE